jgi:hypothetical protein
MKRFVIGVLFFIQIGACHSKQPEIPVTDMVKSIDTTKKNYLPVADYLKSEIANVDSFPRLIKKYQVINGKTDSAIITTPVFDQLAKVFLLAELDSTHFEKTFEENSFVDRSTGLISFTYSTKDTGNGLKRVDVLLTPGDNTTKLNSIYMESIAVNPDSTLIEKMNWKAGKNFKIIRIHQPKKGNETTDQLLVDWDNRD